MGNGWTGIRRPNRDIGTPILVTAPALAQEYAPGQGFAYCVRCAGGP